MQHRITGYSFIWIFVWGLLSNSTKPLLTLSILLNSAGSYCSRVLVNRILHSIIPIATSEMSCFHEASLNNQEN